ncbi:hypothetical protein [Flectobacillus roseus]|uniref:hypothetical protein n=1 Tax=Flectobacillus roseus TaxID=502259 RepID=UPI0024B8623F|nr:hypothetical protein [Flectobacillus roseus]MDI9871325.1 hypothetical protein [Flectobacillus roseus]
MFYFNQKIQLKNDSKTYIFKKEVNNILVFQSEGQTFEFQKDEFAQDNVIVLWETIKLFGGTPIKRLARAN